MLVIQDLTKRFNGQPILEGFDLTVPLSGEGKPFARVPYPQVDLAQFLDGPQEER